MRSRRLGWIETRRLRGLTATQSRPADLFTTAAVPRRSAALDVCAASPNEAAARGDAAQAAFDRKLSHYRQEIPHLRNLGIHCRPLSGQQMSDHTLPSLEHCSMLQTSHPVATAHSIETVLKTAIENLTFFEL